VIECDIFMQMVLPGLTWFDRAVVLGVGMRCWSFEDEDEDEHEHEDDRGSAIECDIFIQMVLPALTGFDLV